jgi:DNA repair protein RadD
LLKARKNCLVLDFAKNIERHGPINQIASQVKKDSAGKQDNRLLRAVPLAKSYVPKASMTCPDCGYHLSCTQTAA